MHLRHQVGAADGRAPVTQDAVQLIDAVELVHGQKNPPAAERTRSWNRCVPRRGLNGHPDAATQALQKACDPNLEYALMLQRMPARCQSARPMPGSLEKRGGSDVLAGEIRPDGDQGMRRA